MPDYSRGYRGIRRDDMNTDPTALAAGGIVVGAIALLVLVSFIFKGKVVH